MTELVTGTVCAVHRGALRPLGPKDVPSGIVKTPAAGPVALGVLGLEGDAQGDTKRHGGIDKAVHVYCMDHYVDWAREFPDQADRFVPGAFGENIVLQGLAERDVCIGDVFELGTARVDLSQARQPCWRLNLHFERRDMARLVQDSGRTGWYFRVLTPGLVAAGAALRCVARPNPKWPLDRVWRLLYRDPPAEGSLLEFAALEGLSASWQALAARRLAARAIEDWTPRLSG